jgi:hypothetical protein
LTEEIGGYPLSKKGRVTGGGDEDYPRPDNKSMRDAGQRLFIGRVSDLTKAVVPLDVELNGRSAQNPRAFALC